MQNTAFNLQRDKIASPALGEVCKLLLYISVLSKMVKMIYILSQTRQHGYGNFSHLWW